MKNVLQEVRRANPEDLRRWLPGYFNQYYNKNVGDWRKFLRGVAGDPAWVQDSRTKITINKLLPIIKTFLAKMFKADPVITVMPRHGEQSDWMKARYGEAVIEYVFARNNYNTERLRVAADVFIFGQGWWKVYWGEFLSGREKEEDIRLTAVHPWEVLKDPLGDRFVAHRYYLPLDKAIERFEKDYQKLYKHSLPKLKTKTYTDITEKRREGVEVIEYYELPSSEHPKGRTIIFADEKIVWEGDLPPWGMPFVGVKEGVSYGSKGLSTVNHLLGPAEYYNRLVNFILDNIETMGSIMMAVGTGNLRLVNMDNFPGTIIQYSAGEQPYQIQPKPLPYHITQMLQTMLMELEEISGQHDVSHGKAPFANMPAAALSVLLEQDDTKMKMTRDLFYDALREVARKILMIAQHKYTQKDIQRAVGRPTGELIAISGKDLDFGDVKIEVTSNMPLTRQGQINFAMMLWDRQIVRDNRKILQLLGLDNMKLFEQEAMADVDKARRENEMLKGDAAYAVKQVQEGDQGALSFVLDKVRSYVIPFEDHETHIREHLTFMKTEKFEEWDPITKQVFLEHVKEHQKYLQPPQPHQGKGGTSLPSFSELPQEAPTTPNPPQLPPEAILGALEGIGT